MGTGPGQDYTGWGSAVAVLLLTVGLLTIVGAFAIGVLDAPVGVTVASLIGVVLIVMGLHVAGGLSQRR